MEGRCISYCRYQEAEEIFERIQEYGLKDTRENRQYLLLERAIFKRTKKEISYSDSLALLQEAHVLNNMAIAYYRIDEKEKAIS
ncbi:MAG: hypothetical protein ACOCMX_01790 [Acetivibrio ethanolgignens]